MTSSSPFDFPSLRCEWLWVYDAPVPTTDVWSKDILVPAGVFFVLKGQGKIEADGRQLDLPAGTAFFTAPGLRRQWFEKGTRLLSVGYRATWPDAMPLFREGLNVARPSSRLLKLHTATRRLFRACHPDRRTVTYREATSTEPANLTEWCQHEAAFRTWFAVYGEALASLGIQSTQRQRPRDERLQEIIRRLDAWPLARALSRDEITEGLHLGGRRMEQLLAAELGLTPHGYLDKRRLESARHLVVRYDVPLKQAAHELGFRHASHFTKWFRRLTGTAPSAWRHAQEGGAV